MQSPISPRDDGLKDQEPWRLLVLGCSSAKRPDTDEIPAAERYDGPDFRLLRKYRAQVCPQSNTSPRVRAFALSAEFGLVDECLPIPPYDRGMTQARARELAPQVRAAAEHLLKTRSEE